MIVKRISYNGYYSSLPSWRWEFDSPYPLERDVAQVVAHLVWDQGVGGSSPVIPTY